MKSGVKLLLEPRVRIPNWIRNQTLNVKVEVTRRYLRKRSTRVLAICGGEALFIPGGSVVVRMPGSDEYWVAFNPMTVLKILDFESRPIAQNYYLCTECATLTGKVENHRQSEMVGWADADFRCTRCSHQWKLRI